MSKNIGKSRTSQVRPNVHVRTTNVDLQFKPLRVRSNGRALASTAKDDAKRRQDDAHAAGNYGMALVHAQTNVMRMYMHGMKWL